MRLAPPKQSVLACRFSYRKFLFKPRTLLRTSLNENICPREIHLAKTENDPTKTFSSLFWILSMTTTFMQVHISTWPAVWQESAWVPNYDMQTNWEKLQQWKKQCKHETSICPYLRCHKQGNKPAQNNIRKYSFRDSDHLSEFE